MSTKRKETATGAEEPGQRKKQRLADARTIAVQSNAVAGPSTVGNGVRRLGGAIDVEKFAEARAFEIDAMQKGMKAASAGATHRVWQTLPRHLRRRAASHDVRRVPLRLRDRAKQEMNSVKKKAPARLRPKQGKDKRLSRTETFLKRQRDKSWLETHIWHAKRMKMENMWGYRLAVTPTEKAFRPSHRASVHGSILHDASYQSIIQIQGPEKIVRTVLKNCCDLQGPGPGAKRFLPGARTTDTHIYEAAQYPFGLIGPATILWRPTPTPQNAQDAPRASTEPTVVGSQKRAKGKGKATETPSVSLDPDTVHRTAWIRTHPGTSDKVFAALRTSASSVLDAARKTGPQGAQLDSLGIELEDLSGQINAFEIMGPKSNQVLKGALSPVFQESREDFKQFWASMTDLQTSGSIPRGMIVGFEVLDPRLRFPPKNAKSHPVSASTIIFPSATLAQSDLWEESTRDSLRKPRYKKKDIDERRSKNLVPGTPLSPLRQDNRVPVLLIQRSVERGASKDQALHGWTLFLPAGWSMPFFSSLIFTGTRVGGQRERQTQAFEAGTAYFPRDYPLCASYDEYASKRETEEQARWERTPPAKRANYARLGTRSPWRADWGVVLGIEEPASDTALVSTQREMGDPVVAVQPWLLRGSAVRNILEGLLAVDSAGRPAALWNEINSLRAKRAMEPLQTPPAALLQGALVRVRITPCTRGRPQDLALIYAVDDAEAQIWRRMQPRSADEEPAEELTLADAKPPQSGILGYVTSGNFSLSHGEGFALGAVPLLRFLDLGEQAQRLASKELLVKVRDRDGHKCRAAFIELLDV
ncbi:ribonucleases P/MRP protein subunit POP1-domain-containing protein [Mycena vitilis]|nr:ribonucleases P/MRP protein subunit POP1-domain-containing protein [Mycena vitilis]